MSSTALFLVLPPSLAHLPCWGEITKYGVTIYTSSRVPRISKQERAFLHVKARRQKYQVSPRMRSKR
jgi:hypothetical protein